jgi:hypothetical protein
VADPIRKAAPVLLKELIYECGADLSRPLRAALRAAFMRWPSIPDRQASGAFFVLFMCSVSRASQGQLGQREKIVRH